MDGNPCGLPGILAFGRRFLEVDPHLLKYARNISYSLSRSPSYQMKDVELEGDKKAQILFEVKEEETLQPIKQEEQSEVIPISCDPSKPSETVRPVCRSPVLLSEVIFKHVFSSLGMKMPYKMSYSPLLRAHSPPPQPCHKVCDVEYSSSMKGQTVLSQADSAVLCGDHAPAASVPALKAQLWLDGAEGSSGMERLLRKCHIRSQLVRECMAECLGVYILILFGCGSVAQVTTTEDKKGQYLSINLGFALGVTFGVFVSRGVSGAHLNPAVSLSLCVLGRHPWLKLPFYIFFQVLGAFLAAATVGLQYYDAIQTYSGGVLTVTGPTATAGIFSTYPADYLSVWGGVVDQVIGTAALLLCVLALGDRKNTALPDFVQPVLVGAAVLVLGISMGSNSGYAINPARDFGPRLFTYIAGWGVDVFKAGGGWWWVPIVAPCVGALLGTLIYELMIEVHHPPSASELHTSCLEVTEGKMVLELGEPDCVKPA